jgi:adenylosuccinate synthase
MTNTAIVTVDLGYGDSGKGTIVDYLSTLSDKVLIVRYSGGGQCSHNVVLPNKKWHPFAQFGSGTLSNDNAITLLSKYVLINPISLLVESEVLKKVGVMNPLSRIIIDENALVTTPFHIAANRLKEISRGNKNHGSCGMGIGETAEYALNHKEALRIKDLKNPSDCATKLIELQEHFKDIVFSDYASVLSNVDNESVMYDLDVLQDDNMIRPFIEKYSEFINNVLVIGQKEIDSLINNYKLVIFEGAQGVLLDENYGFHPYTTWSNTTMHNAMEILKKFTGNVKTLGIIRSYSTRHGAGPFVSELKLANTIEKHNATNKFQQNFRVGPLDLIALRYALKVNGDVDSIALTHYDYVWKVDPYVCDRYIYDGEEDKDFIDHFDFFDRDIFSGNILIKEILKSPKIDLKYQEKLTNHLFKCKPNLSLIKDNFIEIVSESLKTKVSLVSYGPTMIDKKVINIGEFNGIK